MNENKFIHVFLCVNKKPEDHPGKSCGRQGSEDIFEQLKRRAQGIANVEVKLTKSLCLGKCTKGPAAILYPEGNYIRMRDENDINNLLEYLQGKNDINNIIL